MGSPYEDQGVALNSAIAQSAAIGSGIATGLGVVGQIAATVGGPTAQTVTNGIERLERLANSYGPLTLGLVSDLADTLGGPQPPAKDGVGNQSSPQPSHLAARLHGVAGILEGLFSGIGVHAQRAGSAVGTSRG